MCTSLSGEVLPLHLSICTKDRVWYPSLVTGIQRRPFNRTGSPDQNASKHRHKSVDVSKPISHVKLYVCEVGLLGRIPFLATLNILCLAQPLPNSSSSKLVSRCFESSYSQGLYQSWKQFNLFFSYSAYKSWNYTILSLLQQFSVKMFHIKIPTTHPIFHKLHNSGTIIHLKIYTRHIFKLSERSLSTL